MSDTYHFTLIGIEVSKDQREKIIEKLFSDIELSEDPLIRNDEIDEIIFENLFDKFKILRYKDDGC